MAMVRRIEVAAPGGPEAMQLVEREVGEPGQGEIRMRHHAIGLNFIDVYQRSGYYAIPTPHGLGMEGAGVVEAVGAGVSHLSPGDRAAYACQPPGSYAEARVMPATQVCKLPDAISFEHGAGMMLQGLTVQYLFRQVSHLDAGDKILFHAAAGGVGLIACQWARATGVEMIATAGSAEKCALALEHGAAHAINYREENFAERVKEITGGKGVKVVMDSVGKDTWEGSLDSLQVRGLMITFGAASGPVPPFDVGILGKKGSLYLTRPTLFNFIASRDACQAMADDLFEMVVSGKVSITVNQSYPLAQAAQAHRDLEARKTTGTTVLIP